MSPTFSTSSAPESSLGSALNSPGWSVRRIRCRASIMIATWAERKSLSPNVISSVAVVSFSLMTGTTCQASSRWSVWRAFR